MSLKEFFSFDGNGYYIAVGMVCLSLKEKRKPPRKLYDTRCCYNETKLRKYQYLKVVLKYWIFQYWIVCVK